MQIVSSVFLIKRSEYWKIFDSYWEIFNRWLWTSRLTFTDLFFSVILSFFSIILFIFAFSISQHQHSQNNTVINYFITANVSFDRLSYNHHFQRYTSDIESWKYMKQNITIEANDENTMKMFEHNEKEKNETKRWALYAMNESKNINWMNIEFELMIWKIWNFWWRIASDILSQIFNCHFLEQWSDWHFKHIRTFTIAFDTCHDKHYTSFFLLANYKAEWLNFQMNERKSLFSNHRKLSTHDEKVSERCLRWCWLQKFFQNMNHDFSKTCANS